MVYRQCKISLKYSTRTEKSTLSFELQEIYNKLKVFAESKDHFPLVMTFVAFVGTGHQDGQTCYFETKPRSHLSKPFEIWANCKKIFESEESSLNLNRKPKHVFVQLIEGILIIKNPRISEDYAVRAG